MKLRAVFHKAYLITQLLILIGGTFLFFRVIYVSWGLLDGTIENARNCALTAMNKDTMLRSVALERTQSWDDALKGYISVKFKENYKLMKNEADRITKKCSNFLAVDVVEETGAVYVYIVRNGKYEPAYSWLGIIYSLGFVFVGTAVLSVLLFIMRKWIGVIFRPAKSA